MTVSMMPQAMALTRMPSAPVLWYGAGKGVQPAFARRIGDFAGTSCISPDGRDIDNGSGMAGEHLRNGILKALLS